MHNTCRGTHAHLCNTMVKELQQMIIEAMDIEKANRLGMYAQLLPCHHLNDLFQGTISCTQLV